eukprot:12139344-Ditylum_brightwellii.AAC.1
MECFQNFNSLFWIVNFFYVRPSFQQENCDFSSNDAVNVVARYMDDRDGHESSHQQAVACYESIMIGKSTSGSIVSNEPSAEGEV